MGNIDIFQKQNHNIKYNRYTTLTLYKKQSHNLVMKSYNNIMLKQRRDRIFRTSKFVFNLIIIRLGGETHSVQEGKWSKHDASVLSQGGWHRKTVLELLVQCYITKKYRICVGFSCYCLSRTFPKTGAPSHSRYQYKLWRYRPSFKRYNIVLHKVSPIIYEVSLSISVST